MAGGEVRRALVTGASSGIGAEFARQLAARGSDLVLVARREQRLEELAAELSGRHGRHAAVLPADLGDPEQRSRVAARLAAGEAPIDLLVNNAGFGAYGAFADLDADRQAAMVRVNVGAVVALTHAALGPLTGRGRGGIINLASTAAFQPNPLGATYGATKSFVLSFTEAVHEEVRGTGVRVMALCPGFVPTGFQDTADVQADRLPGAASGPRPVVARALRDFARGHAVSVPGVVNRLTSLGAALGPSALTRRVSRVAHAHLAGH